MLDPLMLDLLSLFYGTLPIMAHLELSSLYIQVRTKMCAAVQCNVSNIFDHLTVKLDTRMQDNWFKSNGANVSSKSSYMRYKLNRKNGELDDFKLSRQTLVNFRIYQL